MKRFLLSLFLILALTSLTFAADPAGFGFDAARVDKQTISWSVNPAATLTVPNTESVGTVASTSGLALTLDTTNHAICTVSGTTLTAVGAGDCYITADQGGNAMWKAAAQATSTKVTISAAGGYYYVPGGPPYADYSYSSSPSYAYTFALPAVGTVTATSIGINLYSAAGTHCYLQIATVTTNSFYLVSGSQVQFTPAPGQQDFTISASLSSGTQYYVQLGCNDYPVPYESTSGCTNYATGDQTYTYPPANPLGNTSEAWDNAHCFAIRVGY
jgi:hypothetical protein